MAFRSAYTFNLDSLTAAAYQSTTQTAYFSFDDVANYALSLRTGNWVTGTGQVSATLAHGVQDPDDSTYPAAWNTLLTTANVTAASTVATCFASTSLLGILPYGRVQVTLKNTGAASTDVGEIVAYVLTELRR